MWKKLIVLCISLIGTFSVAYAYYNVEMDATTDTTLAVAANLKSAEYPSGRDGDIVAQKFIIGIYDDTPILFDVVKTGITNDLGESSGTGTLLTSNQTVGYFSSEYSGFINEAIPSYNLMNASLNEAEKKLLHYNVSDSKMGYIFMPSKNESNYFSGADNNKWKLTDSQVITHPKKMYSNPYCTNIGDCPMQYDLWDDYDPTTTAYVKFINAYNNDFGAPSGGTSFFINLRPWAMINEKSFVFAVEAELANAASGRYKVGETFNKTLKARVLDENISIEVEDTSTLRKVMKGQKLNIEYINATTGVNQYVSALIYDDTDTLIEYQIAQAAESAGTAAFDISDYTVGKRYYIQLVNEKVTSDSRATFSSALTPKIPFEFVELHNITYTKTPESNPDQNDYEYNVNVKAGMQIGTVTKKKGLDKIKYEITKGHSNDDSYKNFQIDALDQDGFSTNTNLSVSIKSDAPDLVADTNSLKAGEYSFCVNSIDEENRPATPIEGVTGSNTKVCTSLTIERTDASVSFDHSDTTKKAIGDAKTKWSETATPTPTTGTKVTYSVSSGDIGLIDIDYDSGDITYKGGDAFGSVKIKATVDDNPSTGHDNYETSSVEKEIIIYKEVGGYIQPDSKSSSTTDPTFTVIDDNIKNGGTIGTIIGEDGTPDTIGGSTTTYTYDIDATSTHANFFKVDKTTGKITTTANLSTGTYNIVVTVSDKWSTKNIPVTINVGMATAEELKFYENKTSSKVITKKSVSFTDQNVEVYATVKDSSVTNKVKYSIEDNSTNVITVNENTGAIEIKGVGKVTIVAKKAGASGQAEAVAKLGFEVTSGSFVLDRKSVV